MATLITRRQVDSIHEAWKNEDGTIRIQLMVKMGGNVVPFPGRNRKGKSLNINQVDDEVKEMVLRKLKDG